MDGAGGAACPPTAVVGGRAVGVRPALALARRRSRRPGGDRRAARRCPKSSGGCWRSAASISTMRRVSSRRGCATSCPIRRICATWSAAVDRLVARGARRRDDRRLRRLRCRRRDLGGAAAALLRGGRRRRVGSMSPTACAKATARTPPALLRLQRRGGAARRHRRLRHHRASAAGRRRRGGLDVIVVDHHVAEPLLPRAVAVVNPNRLDETARTAAWPRSASPFCWSSRSTARCARPAGTRARAPSPTCCSWLDLVALGTVCDVVPLTGLNRALVAQGIKVGAARRQSRHRGAGRRRRRHRAARRLPSRLCARARGSMPAAGSAPPIWARGCWRPTTRRSPPNWRSASTATTASAARSRRAPWRRRSRMVEAAPQSPVLDLRRRRGLASRRDRHRRRAAQGALRAPGLRRRARRRHRPRLGPLGRRAAARPGGDRRAPGRAADQRRRPCDGGRVHRRGGQARRAARVSGRAAG